jgi:hypothetical protein
LLIYDGVMDDEEQDDEEQIAHGVWGGEDEPLPNAGAPVTKPIGYGEGEAARAWITPRGLVAFQLPGRETFELESGWALRLAELIEDLADRRHWTDQRPEWDAPTAPPF